MTSETAAFVFSNFLYHTLVPWLLTVHSLMLAKCLAGNVFWNGLWWILSCTSPLP